MGKPQRSQRTQRRGGNREDREHFCNGLGLQATDHFPSKQVWIRAWPQPTPMARSKTPPRPLREAFRMGKPQRSQRTQRRGGNREDREHFCNGLGQQATDHFPSKQVRIRAWPQPTPMARSKTPPRPLREALRMEMGRSGWESGNLFGRARARTRLPTYRSLTASRFYRSEDSGVWGHRRARFPRRGGRRR